MVYNPYTFTLSLIFFKTPTIIFGLAGILSHKDLMIASQPVCWLSFDATSNIWPLLFNNFEKRGNCHWRCVIYIFILIEIMLKFGSSDHWITKIFSNCNNIRAAVVENL